MKPSLRRSTNLLISMVVLISMLFPGVQPKPASAQAQDDIHREYNAETGKVAFITGEGRKPVVVLGASALGMTPEAQSLALVQRFAPEFGLTNPSQELRLSDTDQPRADRVVSKYQQVYQGVPVMAGELIVNANKRGELISINGEVSAGLTLDTNPKMTVETAIEIAKKGMVKWYGGDAKDYSGTQASLWIFDETLLRPSLRPVELVWRIEMVTTQEGAPIRELVLVDAKTGNVSLHFNQVDTAWASHNVSENQQVQNARSTEKSAQFGAANRNSSLSNTETFAVTGSIWYVATTGDDANDCATPATPCANINTAIGKSNSGDTIYVANGRYTKLIYDFSSSFVKIDKSLTLTGGWNSSFSVQDGYSIIDGEKIYAGVSNVAPNATLSNFIITNSYGVGNDIGGFLTLDQVAVINNIAQGVSNSFANMTIKNTTISNNGGIGLVNGGGNISVFNSTITNNVSTSSSTYGGGIRNTFGTVTITNSIVANNSAPQSPDCYNMEYGGGALISNGYNIIGSISGCAITATTGDQFNVNPKLSPLLPSGYQALEPSSPAINAGNLATCMPKDQRGVDRLANAKCDIGAYEYTVPGAATKLFAVNPEIMHAPLNSPFLHPLQVVALDANGSAVGGVSINFSVPNTGPSGSFIGANSNSVNVITTPSGLATSPTLIAGSQIGNFVVNATASNISSVATFNLHNGTWLVSPTGVNTNNCLDVTAPCASVFGVLEKPDFMPGETIWLSSGIYPWPGSTNDAINKDVNIEGGWSSTFNLIEGVSEINGGYFLVPATSVSVKVTRIDFKNVSQIENSGNLVIENSSIRNIDQVIWNTGYGNLTLNNVTVSGKNSMPSAIRNQGILTLLNTTITGNQGFTVGGIENESPGTVYLKNSIIAGNTVQNLVDYASADCVGAFISLGNNIIGTIGSQSIYGNYDCYGNWSATDMLGSDISPIPLSKILVPAIQLDASSGQWSHPLMLNSIAINSGDSCPATDQRGVSRPQGGGCDIGAYEYVFDRSPSSALIRTYDVGNAIILPGTKVCDETNWACPGGDVEAKNVHRFAKDLYDFYLAEHNRLSLDDQGIEILSAVNYGNNYQNAYWNGYMAVFGDGFTNSDDVAIHELTHGVTQYESNLFYFYQSGAINESFSDLWGEYYDQINGLGTDTPAVKWLIGEDIIGATPVRNMSNPSAYGDPDRMTSPNYDISAADNGGVHTNSGVNNKAVSLMVDGGTFNGRTVTALGWDKTEAIYYEAQTNLLSSGSDYSDLYYAVLQACSNLMGQLGITAGDCQQVNNALDAVEMNFQPVTNFTPDAPICPAGMHLTSTLFQDNMEGGAGRWTMTDAWSLQSGYASSSTHMLYGDDVYPSNDSSITAAGIALPVSVNTFLHFKHAFAFEHDGGGSYDGGVLEYTNDNGVTWMDASPLFADGQNYSGVISNYAGTTNTLKGRSAFVNDSHGYVSSLYNLTSLGGQTIKFRWRFATDNSYYYLGWMVDDVQIYTCFAPLSSVTAGVFRPSNGLLYLKNTHSTGFADVAINYGTGGDYPIAGDWNGDGTATIGIYRNGSFYLRNSNTLGFADIVFAFGQPGDQPVAGDWNGDGVDTIGVYRNGLFLLRNSNSAGAEDMSFYLGNPGDVGIAGDWNGDGSDTTGVFRPSNGVIFLKNANTSGFADVALNYGLAGDQPVIGDWNDDGIDTIGVYRNAQFLLRNSNTIGFADIVFALGNPGDMPIAGNWDGIP